MERLEIINKLNMLLLDEMPEYKTDALKFQNIVKELEKRKTLRLC